MSYLRNRRLRSTSAAFLTVGVTIAIPTVACADDSRPTIRIARGASKAPVKDPSAPVPVVVPAATPAVSTSGDDTVYTKDGGVVRGAIVEMIANDHVTLRLSSGKTERISWANVERIERPASAASAVVVPVPTVVGPVPVPATVPASSIRIHVESDSDADVVLEQRDAARRTWVPRCHAPCDADVDRAGEYRIGGGVRGSRSFRLPPGTEGANVIVNPASTGAFVGGIVLAGAGVVTTSVGLYLVLDAAYRYNVTALYGTVTRSSVSGGDTTPGWIVTGVGLAATAVGTVLFATNIRSKVAVTGAAGTASASLPTIPVAVRVPEWPASRREALVPTTSAAFVPTYTFSF
ncbi:MAG: hypothetical protein U0169_01420 [Polyangiaceae bacterium]